MTNPQKRDTDEAPTIIDGAQSPGTADDARTLSEAPASHPLPSAPKSPAFEFGEDAAPIGEKVGDRIGRYTLVRVLGEGGFGSVFLAEQHEPVRRQVAIKIIKLGMDTRQVIARFEAERQALAMMDHPNVARVFDAGATDSGRPFFVMELVHGDPIVDYCDRKALSVEARLRVFMQACAAVQHAHTKGLIHRDIKPSNILVSTVDGAPSVKIIDFGIAKAATDRLTERSIVTLQQQIIGTPEYMSPEQAEGSLDIDTRTDVYALGVVLYELLTGTTPFSQAELRSVAFTEIPRIIRDTEPPKPSTRLGQSAKSIGGRGQPRRRPSPVDRIRVRRTRLDRDAGDRERPRAALRLGQLPGARCRAIPQR